jgi:cytochrome c556
MKYRLMMALAVAIALGACSTMQAGGVAKSGAEVAAARKAGMEAVGKAQAAVTAESKKTPVDAAALSASIDALNAAGKDLPTWFPANSGPGQGFETRAKAEIWSDGKFADATKAYTVALNDLHASKSADVATVSAKLAAFGGSCGGCHRTYRGPAPGAPPPAAPPAQ